MPQALAFPIPGSVVEFLEDNQIQIALVLEEAGGKLRLLLPTRRESKLGANRILPWIGPAYSPGISREDAIKILERHKAIRQEKTAAVNTRDVWELAAGEIAQAPASWFAELFITDPDIDDSAAFGHALLEDKSRFRFNSPDFTVYDAETVSKREEESQKRLEREALAGKGAAFFSLLWNIASRKRPAPADFAPFLPDAQVAAKLESMLREHLINPDTQNEEALWKLLVHGLPDDRWLPLQLLQAWSKLPPHYNFWLERADYDQGEWWLKEQETLEKLEADLSGCLSGLPECDSPFVSIDGDSTTDIDDAFFLKKTHDGWLVRLAFANPALSWPFGSHLDKMVSQRATSLYLPEATLHMLPANLGDSAFSLWAGEQKPALCMDIQMDEKGILQKFEPYLAKITPAENLRYPGVESFLTSPEEAAAEPAANFAEMLNQANELAILLEKNRVANGAVVMLRKEVAILLSGSGEETLVELETQPDLPNAHRIVTEFMVLASAAVADWANQQQIPLIHRTQKTTLPPEYAGVWGDEVELARIMKAMIPSILEIKPGWHAGLGVPRYAPLTSPLRRYADLVNEKQLVNFLQSGKPAWEQEQLEQLLNCFSPHLESSTQVQKFRPRYWKLLHFRQKGDKVWWQGVITDETDLFVFVSLPEYGLLVRGKRELFDERAAPGMKVQVRLGKINPLYNEIHILESMQG